MSAPGRELPLRMDGSGIAFYLELASDSPGVTICKLDRVFGDSRDDDKKRSCKDTAQPADRQVD